MNKTNQKLKTENIKITWESDTRLIGDLRTNSKNPRQITKKKAQDIVDSLKRFGVCQPFVINTDNMIIGGHQRFAALKRIGTKVVNVYVPSRELTEKEVDELCIRLNKNTGDWDFDLLANSFEPVDLCEWGFTLKELHLDDMEEQKEEKPKKFALTANFENEDDLREAETHIATILDLFASASYKVKIK